MDANEPVVIDAAEVKVRAPRRKGEGPEAADGQEVTQPEPR